MTVRQWHDGLHRPLTVGLLTDDGRATMILQSTRHDLGCGGRARVDQHHQRRAVEIVARLRVHFETCIGCAAVRRHDHAFVEECIGHTDGRIEQAARIVAQVEHQSAQLAIVLLLQLGDSRLQIGRRRLTEVRDLDVAIAWLEQPMLDAVKLHVLACQHEIQRFGRGVAGDGDLDRRARFATHTIDRVVQILEIHRHFIDGENPVACQHARLVRRAAFDRIDDTDRAILERDFDSHTRVFARGADADLVQLVGIEEGGVRIEIGDDSADGRIHQLLVGHLLDVVVADQFDYFGEQARILPRHRASRFRSRIGHRCHRQFALGLDWPANRQSRTENDASREHQQDAKRFCYSIHCVTTWRRSVVHA